MANPIPPMPIKNPVVDENGILSRIWTSFFQAVFNRIGGTAAQSNSDLSALVTGFLNGDHFAALTSNATSNDGTIIVDHPDRFVVGQKVVVSDALRTFNGYVKTIGGASVKAGTIVLVTTLGGSTLVDFSAGDGVTVVNGAKCYGDEFRSFAEDGLGQGRAL